MKKTAWLLALIIPAILVVAGFQVYWLGDTWQREKKTLDIKVNTAFGEMVRAMQDSSLEARFKTLILDSNRVKARRTQASTAKARIEKLTTTDVRITRIAASVSKKHPEDSVRVNLSPKSGVVITFQTTDSLKRKVPIDSIDPTKIQRITIRNSPRTSEEISGIIDSLRGPSRIVVSAAPATSTLQKVFRNTAGAQVRMRPVKVSYRDSSANGVIRIDSLLSDTLPVDLLTKRFSYKLDSMHTPVPFSVLQKKGGLIAGNPSVYEIGLGNTTPYLLKRLSLPIVFSIGLVTITLLAFFLLYAGLKRQQRLAAIKQEFISNITHELKTPIATVGVAIEALRNFNALNDPARTREYLDISRNELQRLSLLVDKVLKLSMFEKKEIELRTELVNVKELVEEVAESMRLQLEKQQASLSVKTSGECTLNGDKLHLQSLVFNLVDNALKYSRENPQITIDLEGSEQGLKLEVSDNGIGIPNEYRQKVFEKFFRVPHGDTHNAKGHGLGLSYVAQVVAKHNGTIHIEPAPGGGTTFIIHFPK